MGTPEDAPSQGRCFLCDRSISKRGMTTHLRTCRGKRAGDGSAQRRRTRPAVHLAVTGSPLHWLHLEIDRNARLADLDDFLRRTWLECCGHLSEFEVDGVRYGGGDDDWMDYGESRTMEVSLGSVLRKGTTFRHTYDYGSTTQCALRVVALDDAPIGKNAILVLARNDPPVFPCSKCDQPAVSICTECMWSEDAWLCAPCAKAHECGEEMLLPVVDSPRVGVCGYSG